VENVSPWHLSTEPSGTGLQDIVWCDSDGNSAAITDTISSGKLKGWCEVRDNVIPDYLNRLDALANGIRGEVNNLHASGYGLDGSTGSEFFTGTSAVDLTVNPTISDDPSKIAASASSAGLPGDNSIAIAITNLQNALTMNGGTGTFDDYFNSLVTDVGSQVEMAGSNLDHQSSMVDHLDNYRESISGVSLDEEMVNLIKFQHAYDAAAKLITTVDELLNTLINMV
jgi:flagellar hook-associated protein 1 FlgK